LRSLKELSSLRGRAVLVTGGAGHIGGAMCDAVAELGADVVVVDLSKEACERAAARLESSYGVRALPLAVDLSNMEAVRAVPGVVERELGRLDVLAHSAALVCTSGLQGWAVPFAQQGLEAWNAALGVNLTAPFVLSQAAAPLLAASGRGAIIAVASIYGMVGPDWRLYEGTPMANPAAYSASKGALLQLVRWLATTLGPKIRANAITPGGVFRDTKEPFLSRYVSRVPLGRMATEEDFKGATAFLASDLSAYVTGQNIVVDGGWTS
jgi:NAD(P)-dependent dehydrogenase (short-subunit alcohol dehydrogenase family)